MKTPNAVPHRHPLMRYYTITCHIKDQPPIKVSAMSVKEAFKLLETHTCPEANRTIELQSVAVAEARAPSIIIDRDLYTDGPFLDALHLIPTRIPSGFTSVYPLSQAPTIGDPS